MKKFLLLIVLAFYANANATHVQITFVEGFVIYPIYDSDFTSSGQNTSDSAINTIFLNHGVTYCYNGWGGTSQIIFAAYSGTGLANFITELESNVNVASVKISPIENVYADRVYVNLVSGAVGNPTGTDANGNVVTTSTALNAIFETYNVIEMTHLIGTWYEIRFTGIIGEFRNALENITNEIAYVEYVNVSFLLNTGQDSIATPTIYPNPFTDSITIDTTEAIAKYTLVDITGKQLVSTTSKIEFDTACADAEIGVYILKLDFIDNRSTMSKIIKK